MESLYKPDGVESRWQELWEAEGLYAAGVGATRDESYVICVPPPNVTGDLHLGHALNGSIQDVLIRWHRMQGYRTLWQPGYDHAGISTQNVVEKQLAAEGLTRHDLGREAFIERTWEWLEKTGRTIMGQYRRLGASLDYSRERFTLDDALLAGRDGVLRAALGPRLDLPGEPDRQLVPVPPDRDLGPRGRARRDGRRAHLRALSVRRTETATDGIVIATVRPATILGDVAVAVHPDDQRYRDAVGREVVVPYVERAVPVIADARVEPSFGSGALKITPGHDPLDFEIGRDHGLPEPMVIGLDGRMNDQAGDLAGPDPGRGRRGGRRLDQGARPARQAGELPALGRHLRAVPFADRAADLAPVVVRDGGAGRAGDRGAARAARALPSRVAAPVRDRVAGGDPRLVPLAAALVGASAADLDDAGAARSSAPRPRRRRRSARAPASS